MPEFFAQWLTGLSDEQAEQMWEYFDGYYSNCEDVVGILTSNRPELVLKVCGPQDLTNKVSV